MSLISPATSLQVVSLLILSSQTVSKDSKQAPQETAAQAEYRRLTEEFARREKDYVKEYSEAKTDEQRLKVQDRYPRPESVSPKLLELAQKNANDPVAFDALVWIVNGVQKGPDPAKALELIERDYVREDRIGKLCNELVSSYTEAEARFLRAELEKNPTPEIKAIACLSLARQLLRRSQMKAQLDGLDAFLRSRIEKEKGKEFFTLVEHYDTESLRRRAQGFLDRLVKDYGAFELSNPKLGFIQKQYPSKRTIAEAAVGPLFEVRHLAIGMTAPEIEGEDLDGHRFKLSDYRGKVVLLDFWGHW